MKDWTEPDDTPMSGREKCAYCKLPDARLSVKKRVRLALRHPKKRASERSEGDRAQRPDRAPMAMSFAKPREAKQQQWPNNIKLLFNAERPEMENRGRSSFLVKIIDGALGEAIVREVEQSRNDIVRGCLALREGEDRCRNKQSRC